jgi:MAternally-affected-uncoordination protein
VQMKEWFIRFPTILQACESIIEMLRGQYAHSVGCYSEAAFHYIEAAKVFCCYCHTTVGPLLTNFNFDGLNDA